MESTALLTIFEWLNKITYSCVLKTRQRDEYYAIRLKPERGEKIECEL